MKVFVTGSRGFTGKYFCQLLREQQHEAIEAQSDITDLAALTQELQHTQPEYIVHLAALSFVAHHDQAAMYQINLFGTLNILQGLQNAKLQPKKILIASSANVYGNPNVSPTNENICPQPVNHYANSKLAMEHMVRTWLDIFPIIITRPFNYTGIGQNETFLIPKIISHYKAKKTTIELGNLQTVRDFSDVRDVVKIYLQLLQIAPPGLTINVCSGQGILMQDVIDMANQLSGITITPHINPEFIRPNEIHTLIGDTKKLQGFIGDMTRIPFIDTLRWMLHA